MRDCRPVATGEAAADAATSAAGDPDGGGSVMRALASAAHIARPRVAPKPRTARAIQPSVHRIDLSALTAVPPLHRATVTGAGASHPGDHVGGSMLSSPVNTVALSDGTRISFGAVGDVPVLEHA
jgi:hypothetical protein